MTAKRIIFAGTPDFSVPCLQALLESKHQVCAVYTQPDRPAGRGRQLQASPIKQLALTKDIAVYQPLSLKNAEAQTELQALQADLMVVVAYGLILPKVVLDSPRFGCVNVHASILPRWRGAAPIQRALLAGDTATGVTLMQMDVGLDTGDMLATAHCAIEAGDTSQILHDRLSLLGAQLLAQHIDEIENLPRVVQDSALANYASKLDKAEAVLDWHDSAAVLARKVRGYNPFPIATVELAGMSLRVWSAQVIESKENVAVGTLLRATKEGLDVMTGDGVLRLLSVQKAGGKVLSAADFLNGHPQLKTG